MSDIREFKITGVALEKKKTRKLKGGNSSGQESTKHVDSGAQNTANQFASSVKNVLTTNFGPDKAQQFGGKQSGGNTGAIVNLASSRTAPSPGPVAPLVSGAPLSTPAPVGGGNGNGSGLVLAPRRKNRISLRAKKGGSTASVGDVPPPAGGTRKARKIHIRVKGVTARVAKAKKAKKEAMGAPIAQVKAKLESSGVIKKGSKAPESMLRTMYADLLITKKGL